MNAPPASRAKRAAEALAAAGLLLWRLLVHSPHPIYADWITILAVYWIFTIFFHRTRPWVYGTALTMILLVVLYLHGQMPHTLSALGIGS